MSDDTLREASRALRDLTAESSAGERFTRARVMASLHQRRRRRSTAAALLVPLAAILAGSTAWAGATDKLAHVWMVVSQAVGISVAEPPDDNPTEPQRSGQPARRQVKPGSNPGGQPSVAAPVAEPEPPEEEPPLATETQTVEASEPPAAGPAKLGRAAAAPRAARAGRGVGAKDTNVSPTASAEIAQSAGVPKPAAPGPDQHELYRAAHQAHFGARDCTAALRAWNEYLSLAPRGRFSAEAQYNRALCLVRLGRTSDAAIALAPFARGAYGTYRQREARELLEALSRSAP